MTKLAFKKTLESHLLASSNIVWAYLRAFKLSHLNFKVFFLSFNFCFLICDTEAMNRLNIYETENFFGLKTTTIKVRQTLDSSDDECLCDPLKAHFYGVKRGFTGLYIIFLIFL